VQRLEVAAVDDLEGVDDVAEALAHLAAVLVAHHGVEVDGLEGQGARELEAHHDHARDPEEEDVVAGLEEGVGVEGLEVGVLLVGPAEGGEGEEAGAEPRVEDVLVLREGDGRLRDAEAGGGDALGVLGRARDDPAVGLGVAAAGRRRAAVDGHLVGRDAVPPPQLARDAPVADVVHPVEPDRAVDLGEDVELAAPRGVRGALGHAVALDVPLRLDERLDDVARAAAHAEAHLVVGLAAEELLLVEGLGDGVARVVAHHAAELLAAVVVDAAVLGDDGDEGEAVLLAADEVVGVVGRGDLDGAGPEGHVDEVRVGDDGDEAVAEGVDEHLAVEVGVARVGRVDGDGGVAEEGLGARGGDDDLLVGRGAVHLVGEGGDAAELVLHLGVVARDGELGALLEVDVLDLDVRDGGAEGAAPVHEAVVAVDEALLVEADEGLVDGLAEALVHGEALARPVRRDAEVAQLGGDLVAVGLLPPPHLLDEGLAAEVVARHAPLLLQALLDDGLGRDAGVVRAGEPEGVAPVHAVPAGEAVLDGRGEGVAQVERARHVGRRDDHDEAAGLARGRGGGGVGGVEALLRPPRVPRGLDGLRVVGGEHLAGEVLHLAGGGRVDVVVPLHGGLLLGRGRRGRGLAGAGGVARASCGCGLVLLLSLAPLGLGGLGLGGDGLALGKLLLLVLAQRLAVGPEDGRGGLLRGGGGGVRRRGGWCRVCVGGGHSRRAGRRRGVGGGRLAAWRGRDLLLLLCRERRALRGGGRDGGREGAREESTDGGHGPAGEKGERRLLMLLLRGARQAREHSAGSTPVTRVLQRRVRGRVVCARRDVGGRMGRRGKCGPLCGGRDTRRARQTKPAPLPHPHRPASTLACVPCRPVPGPPSTAAELRSRRP
jgi:hypothetical protein